ALQSAQTAEGGGVRILLGRRRRFGAEVLERGRNGGTVAPGTVRIGVPRFDTILLPLAHAASSNDDAGRGVSEGGGGRRKSPHRSPLPANNVLASRAALVRDWRAHCCRADAAMRGWLVIARQGGRACVSSAVFSADLCHRRG